jgi:hypothetical protein
MAIPSGLSAQLMTAEEVTYGTPVTTDRAYEFRQESLKLEVQRIESSALRAGTRMQRSDRWTPGRRSVSGDVTMELGTKGFGRWWKHALGGVATTQPDAANSPTVYKHTFTPGDLPIGQTIQVGRPDVGATVRPFTYHGCKIASWTLECSVNELAVFQAAILGEDCDTATALATASYPAGLQVMPFIQGALTVGGSSMDVKQFSMQGTNMLADERFFLGSALRKQPLEVGMRNVGGTFEPEFTNLTAYAAFVAGTEAELVLLFQGDIIEDALRYETKVTANVRYDDGTPNVGGPQILANPIPYKVIDNGTTSVKIEYQTTDATP